MKYWKQGFYDEPQEGSVEISEEYWLELLNGQSEGKLIGENDEGYPILIVHQPSINELIENKLMEINHYDISEAVNSFTLSGASMWLDKSTRVGLMNSITIEKEAGKTQTTLWFDGNKYVIPVDTAILMLNALELYALDCYNVTQSHIAAVRELGTVEAIGNYDYRSGYPEKLVFG